MTTALRRWSPWVLAAAMVASAGCGDPPPMIKITPAGSNVDQLTIDTSDESYRAKAIGETPAAREGAEGSEERPESGSGGAAYPQTLREATVPGEVVELENGMTIETLVEGDPDGAVAVVGATIRVRYRGTLEDGTEFDSTLNKPPYTSQLKSGQLIQGWIEGIPGMRVGEKRKLTIPSKLGYGARGFPPKIPPNATLTFEIELLGVN